MRRREVGAQEWSVAEMLAGLWCAGAVRVVDRVGRSGLGVPAQGLHLGGGRSELAFTVSVCNGVKIVEGV